MNKIFTLLFKDSSVKRIGEWSYICRLSSVFSATFRWWRTSHPVQFTPSTRSVREWGRPYRWSGCGGESKDLCFHRIFPFHPSHHLVRIQTEVLSVKLHACLESCHFQMCTDRSYTINYLSLKLTAIILTSICRKRKNVTPCNNRINFRTGVLSFLLHWRNFWTNFDLV